MHLLHTGEWRFENNDLVITLRSEYGGDDNDGDYYAADTEWRIPLAELAEALRKAEKEQGE
jgi:hypothetical protein